MTRAATLPDHDAMVRAILDVLGEATPGHLADGILWYPTAGRMVRAIASVSGIDPRRVVHALAALSPRNPWRWNVADAYAFACAAGSGRPMPTATTYTACRRAAWRALHDPGEPWTTAAPKVRAFVAAILGDPNAVVVDAWTMRVVTGGTVNECRPRQYAAVVEAYRDAAARVGCTPATLQAITWRVAQDAALGQRRAVRHSTVFKRGTPALVRSLFTECRRSEPMA